jgi:hypothetical protein
VPSDGITHSKYNRELHEETEEEEVNRDKKIVTEHNIEYVEKQVCQCKCSSAALCKLFPGAAAHDPREDAIIYVDVCSFGWDL